MLIKGFQEVSFVDWRDHVAAVIFLSGCNMWCGYCHNYKLVTDQDSLKTIPFDVVFKGLDKLKDWLDGVVISGGEPTINKELPKLLEILKDNDFKTKVDTNGSNPDMLLKIVEEELVDCISLDIKAPLTTSLYSRVTSVDIDISLIKRSLSLVQHNCGVSFNDIDCEIRVTLSPLLKISDYKDLISQLSKIDCLILQKFRGDNILDNSLNNLQSFSDDEIRELGDFASKHIENVTLSGVST